MEVHGSARRSRMPPSGAVTGRARAASAAASGGGSGRKPFSRIAFSATRTSTTPPVLPSPFFIPLVITRRPPLNSGERGCALEGAEEGDEVRLLAGAEADAEARVVEVDQRRQIGRRAVVEERRTR